MATSSITANFTCNDSKAANAFVRMLVQPVKVIKRDQNACHAAEFKSEAEMRAFCLKMARVARKRTAERARTTKRRVSKGPQGESLTFCLMPIWPERSVFIKFLVILHVR